ncbi:VENN motif pre-toxin domain-containing protein [Duganella sp. Root336D2]|uniref:VENN motif pre-toxin domain-containing protein n=1 Tax=Duganella sp. Root336D2 TaxID=1736518 RepID=UPI0035A33348
MSHAVLGAALAVANNSSAVSGALAGGGGELAAQVLTKELYPQAFDANGVLQRDKLTPDQVNNVSALSSAIGALLSGTASDGIRDAVIGGQIATNAIENNYLSRAQAGLFKKKLDACEAQKGGCPDRKEIINEFKSISDANDKALEVCILHADLACINSASKDIATESDLPMSLVRTELSVFNGSNKWAASRAAYAKDHINDLIKSRELLCGPLSQAACDARISRMKGDATIRALKVAALGLGGGVAPEALAILKGGLSILVQAGRFTVAELVELGTIGPVSYCRNKPLACFAAVDTAASTAAGVPISGVSIPHLPNGSSTGANAIKEEASAVSKIAGSTAASEKTLADGLGAATKGLPAQTANQLKPPVPRVDVSSKFEIEPYNGIIEIDYLDADKGIHGLNAYIDRAGRLSFEIRAKGNVADLGSGTDMFASMMLRLEREKIELKGITGTWSSGGDSVNTAQYLENLALGMTPEVAAANTWTGRMAARYGFTSVTVPPGQTGSVRFVYFKKPEQ